MAEADAANALAVAFEDAFAQLRGQVEAACADANPEEWSVRVAGGVKAAFAFAVAEPDTARLLTSEALTGSEESRDRFQRLISYFAGLLCSVRPPDAERGRGPGVAEIAMTGGIVLLVGQRLANGRENELPAAASDAAQLVLTPWVGRERARQIAAEHC